MGYKEQTIENAKAIQLILDSAKKISQLPALNGTLEGNDMTSFENAVTGETFKVKFSDLASSFTTLQIQFFDTFIEFPEIGFEDKLYVSFNDFSLYIWNGIEYVSYTLSIDDIIGLQTELDRLNSEIEILKNSNTAQPNELIEKGFHHISGFDWYVFAQVYRFNGVLYETPEDLVIDTVTIDPAPTTVDFKRFDVVVFNDDFTFSVVKGTESLTPAIPKIDILTQIQLTVILVEYGTTEPIYLTKQLMYDEGVGLPDEFAVTKTGTSIEIDNIEQSSSGTKSIKVTNPVNSDVLFLDKNVTFNSLDIDTISFKIKNGQKSNPSFYLYSYNSIGAFYQGTTEIKNGKYGYDSQNITDWQIIIVPRSKILGGSEIHNTGWALTFKPTTGTYYFDEFAMNGNFTQAPITSGIAEAPIDDDYYVRRNAGWFGIGTLMTAWNNAVTWITTNGANVLAHLANKQNSLATDGTGEKYPTVDAVNAGLATKLDASAYNQHFKGVYLTFAALVTANPTGEAGDYAQVNVVGASDVLNYNWDAEESVWIPNAVGGSGATNTDELPEGTTNLYHTGARVLATILSGLSIITGGDVVATDTVLEAFGKLQKNINDLWIAVNLNTDKVSFPEAPIDTKQYARKDGGWIEVVSSGGTGTSNIAAGAFNGVIDVSQGNNIYYDDYDAGAIVNLTLSAIQLLGSIATVRVKGDLLGTIPSLWNYSGQPITANASKYNELTLLYATSNDIRIVNRVVNYVDNEAPSVPTGLASSNITDTSATLTWNASTDNVGVVAYKIRKDGVLIASPTVLTYSVTGLTASTSYSFTVLAIDAAGNESAQSTAVIVETITTPVVAFETEYQAVLDYATANSFELPSATQQTIDNNKVKYLKQVGAWAELDTMQIFNATYTPSSWAVNFYRLNFKNPSAFTLYATSGLEPTYVSGNGFKVLGGSEKFAKTGWQPLTHAVKYTGANCSEIFGLFDVPTAYTSPIFISGGREANDARQILIGSSMENQFMGRLTTTNVLFNLNQNLLNNHFHIYRNDAITSYEVYMNGVTNFTKINNIYSETTLTNTEQYLFGVNNNGVLIKTDMDLGIKYYLKGSALNTLKNEVYQIMNETYIP